MKALNAAANILFLPGTLMLKALNIPLEADNGIFRSLVNSVFWGALALWAALAFWV